jgi:hypothetical protein
LERGFGTVAVRQGRRFPGCSLHGDGGPTRSFAELAAPFVTLGFLALGATGRGTLHVPVPALGPASSPMVFGLQALVIDSGVGAFATNPRPLVLR